jgi:AraC family transcriptional regulator, ethanolamine operon transcriptional activator
LHATGAPVHRAAKQANDERGAMARRVFTDFDEFADSITGVEGRFLPTGLSSASWWIDRMELGGTTLQHVQIGSAATFAGTGIRHALTIGLPVTDPDRMRIDGRSLSAHAFVVLRDDQPFTFTGCEVSRWAAATVGLGHPMLGEAWFELARRSEGPHAQAHRATLENLCSLVTRACSGDAACVRFDGPTAMRAAEQDILAAAARVLEHSSRIHESRVGRPYFPRERLIARTLELVEAHRDRPLLLGELCSVLAVSERTLRNVFQEYFGVGPIRFLKLRQLREINAALSLADPARETVTHLAGRFGVWDFSLFARNYKRLYGESPSETLRKPPASAAHHGSSWFSYAARVFTDCAPLPDVVRNAAA